MKTFNKRISITLVIVLLLTLSVPMAGFAVESAVDLGTADSFGVLAGSTITNTGPTIITGDIGLHPGTAFTGQGTVTMIDGSIAINNAVALQAKNDLQTAYTDADGRTINTIGAQLGGTTLTPGVYSSATSFQITGTLTLDAENNADAVFIFQAGSTLTTASNSNVELINGATAKNVFWQVGSSATLGSNSYFAGTILASESITAISGAEILGQLLALNGAVTLDSNTITIDRGSLTVQKTVTGDTGSITLPVFQITLTGPEDFSSTRTFVDDGSYTWENLVPGEYNVTESRTGLSTRWRVNGEGAIQELADQSHEVSITNLYRAPSDNTSNDNDSEASTTVDSTPIEPPVGSLTVEKNVLGDIGDMTVPVFKMTVTGPDDFSSTRTFIDNESYTWENLEPGEYNITESRIGLSNEWTVSGEGTVQITANQMETAIVTNDYGNLEALPQTGQITNYNMAILYASIAAIIAGLGISLENKKKKLD